VIVVAHEAVGVNAPAVTVADRAQQRQEASTIVVVRVDAGPGVAAGRDVIEGVFVFEAQGTGHAGNAVGRNAARLARRPRMFHCKT
jgi:hypothetical protein